MGNLVLPLTLRKEKRCIKIEEKAGSYHCINIFTSRVYLNWYRDNTGRQAPQFRLPAGKVLKPGVTYRVYAQWVEIDVKSFVANEIAPLSLQSAKTMDEKSFELHLRNDPQSDLLAG